MALHQRFSSCVSNTSTWSAGTCASLRGMYHVHVLRFGHNAKQVLILVPCTIWGNEFATGILPLAFDSRCDKVLRNRDTPDMPMLEVPLEVRLVHDVYKATLHVTVFCMGGFAVTNTALQEIVEREPFFVGFAAA